MSSQARVHQPSAPPAGPEETIRKAGAAISQAKAPERQQAARGRRFVHVYVGALLVAGALVVALGLLAHSTATLLRYDVPIERALQRVHAPLYNWVLTHESDFGFPPLNIVSYGVVFVLLIVVRLRTEAVLAVVSAVLAGVVGSLIKQAVGRVRPTASAVHVVGHVTGYSFPSGHVIQYTTLFGFCFYLVLVVWRGGWLRALALSVLALLVLLVGPSRVFLGQHWPSDVLGAYLFAGIWLAGTIELQILLKQRIAWWSPPRNPRTSGSWHRR
jgi:membrane-associated phospholipid phosphatase